MQVQIDIEFEQLLKLVKNLPAERLNQLKAEIEKGSIVSRPEPDLKTLLLNGPVATKEQLEVIENNRKAINQWRKK